MSHLACADEPEHPKNAGQLALFREMLDSFPNVPASLANSAGILLGRDYHFDLVRPGIALYGGAPMPARPDRSRRDGRGAHPAGSRRRRKARRWATARRGRSSGRRRLAILAAGYADGYLRAAGGRRRALRSSIAGHRAPIAGRVSMDLMAVDVTDVPARCASATAPSCSARTCRSRRSPPPPARSPTSSSRASAAGRSASISAGSRLMARARAQYVCANCGAVSSRWQGRCDSCGEWNTLQEEAAGIGSRSRCAPAAAGPSSSCRSPARRVELPRTLTGIAEFDRVTGGGFVPGSALLVGGDPGIGKSTHPDPGGRRARPRRAPRRLCLGRGGDRADPPARRAARPRAMRRWSSPPRRMSRTSSPRSRPARRSTSSSSIRSRRCGPTSPRARPAPSRRCAPRRRR